MNSFCSSTEPPIPISAKVLNFLNLLRSFMLKLNLKFVFKIFNVFVVSEISVLILVIILLNFSTNFFQFFFYFFLVKK